MDHDALALAAGWSLGLSRPWAGGTPRPGLCPANAPSPRRLARGGGSRAGPQAGGGAELHLPPGAGRGRLGPAPPPAEAAFGSALPRPRVGLLLPPRARRSRRRVKNSLPEMGETFSQFWKVSDQKERGGKSSLCRRNEAGEDDITNYGTINGGDSAASCMPCVGTASRGCINCPTCQGTGRIPREQEKELVALIPYGDQRLKPRRTKLYVSLAVTICLLSPSLIIFFLFPRSIAVQPAGLNASSVAFNATVPSINLNMTNVLNVTNNNFYSVAVTQLDIEVLHLSLVIGKATKKNLMNIGPLRSGQIYYTVSSHILDYNTYNICTWIKIKVHNVLLHIQGTLTCSYLCHSEQLAFESYQYVDCRGNATLPHPLYHRPP